MQPHNGGTKMRYVAFPTKYEIYIDGDTEVIAKFKMFDDESFNVEIDRITCPKELREIAGLLEEVLKLNEKGVSNE